MLPIDGDLFLHMRIATEDTNGLLQPILILICLLEMKKSDKLIEITAHPFQSKTIEYDNLEFLDICIRTKSFHDQRPL